MKEGMNSLKERITADLKSFTEITRVWPEIAMDDEVFPYIVFHFQPSIEREDREDFPLDIDVWDKGSDSEQIDRIVDTIDGDGSKTSPTGLHRRRYTVLGDLQAMFYRVSRMTIPDPDPTIRHRRLRYLVHVYFEKQ